MSRPTLLARASSYFRHAAKAERRGDRQKAREHRQKADDLVRQHQAAVQVGVDATETSRGRMAARKPGDVARTPGHWDEIAEACNW